jgi:cyanophycinase
MITTHATMCALLLCGHASAQGYICAHGGDFDVSKQETTPIISWLVESSGKGPVVIIGAVPLDKDDRAAAFTNAGSVSVQSLVITKDNAEDPAVYSAIASAKLVFIRGGDQSRYTNWWGGTGTVRAIRAVFDKGGVVCGTSAGCAVLGEVTYDARNGSLSPSDALGDSRHQDLTLVKDCLGLVPGVLFDTHFTERGRIARLPVMMEFARAQYNITPIGIGVDHMTALCIDPSGHAKVLGLGGVTILTWPVGVTYDAAQPGQPPDGRPVYPPIALTYVPAGNTFTLTGAKVSKLPDLQPRTSPTRLRSATVGPKTVFTTLTKFLTSQIAGTPRESLVITWNTGTSEDSAAQTSPPRSALTLLIDSAAPASGTTSPVLGGSVRVGPSLEPTPR